MFDTEFEARLTEAQALGANGSVDNAVSFLEAMLERCDRGTFDGSDRWLEIQRRIILVLRNGDKSESDRALERFAAIRGEFESFARRTDWPTQGNLRDAGIRFTGLATEQIRSLREEDRLDDALEAIEYAKETYENLAGTADAEFCRATFMAECALVFQRLGELDEAATLAGLAVESAARGHAAGAVPRESQITSELPDIYHTCLEILKNLWLARKELFGPIYLDALQTFISVAGDNRAMKSARNHALAMAAEVIRGFDSRQLEQHAFAVGQCCLAYGRIYGTSSSRSRLRAAAVSLNDAVRAFQRCEDNGQDVQGELLEAQNLQTMVDDRRRRAAATRLRERRRRQKMMWMFRFSGALVVIGLLIGLMLYGPDGSECIDTDFDSDEGIPCVLRKDRNGVIVTPLPDHPPSNRYDLVEADKSVNNDVNLQTHTAREDTPQPID